MQKVSSFSIVPKIVFGQGCLSALPDEIRVFGSRVLMIIDPSLVDSPPISRLMDKLAGGGFQTTLFTDVEPEPWVETADEAGETARKTGCECVVGIGGGSVMDVAKAASVLAANPGKASDYQGLDLVKNRGIPKIMVPTTSGTGSEVTFTAVLSKRETKTKGGINSRHLYPDTAVLDAELTVGLSPFHTATTGMDALTHAIESYTSAQSGFLSDIHAKESIRLIAGNLSSAVKNGSDLTARENMLLASLLGGISLANAGVGAVHALAYPLGGSFRIPHGVANGLLLPYVMRFNRENCREKYAEIAGMFAVSAPGEDPDAASEKAVAAVETLAGEINVPVKLSQLGVGEKHLNEMASSAMQVKRPLDNNPRKVGIDEAINIYRDAL